MKTQTFEIKVALLGYVSVGKTTVLNALLQDKFSEVSMRRTTAGINFFRIVTPSSGKRKPIEATNAVVVGGRSGLKTSATTTATSTSYLDDDVGMEWSPLVDEPVRTATSTLTEITQDNKKLREEKEIQEKTFNIEVGKPLCEMRNDTTLVFVDVPGLNEAGSKKMYLNYVAQNWDTFDCVIIVMDAEKGVNTEEQVELLKFVKENLETSKNIPVLVICNKVDDPDDDELMELVGEVRTKVEEVFDVGDRAESLRQLIGLQRAGKHVGGPSVYPAFIPLSAGNAFAYRMAANCSLEQFKKLDIKLIDKIGRDEIGKVKWKKLPLDQKYRIVYGAVGNAAQYQEHLEATNFDKFLSALSYCVGGSDIQRALLAKQIEVSLRKLSADSPVVQQLRSIYDRCKAIKHNPEHLKVSFWEVFETMRDNAINSLKIDFKSSLLVDSVDQLIAYSDFVREVGWEEEEGKIVEEMVSLVGQQVGVVLEKENEWRIDDAAIARYTWRGGNYHSSAVHFPWDWERDATGWRNRLTNARIVGGDNPALVSVTWRTLTYLDWTTIIGSLLLMANNRHFCERLGREKMLLERLLHCHTQYANCMTNGKTTAEGHALANISQFSEGRYEGGKFIPNDPLKYSLVAQVIAPALISDPSHWGHVIWKFCKFMDKVDN